MSNTACMIPLLVIQNVAFPVGNDGLLQVSMFPEIANDPLIEPSGVMGANAEYPKPGFVEMISPSAYRLSSIKT
jgi:hypothetical protein